MTVLTDLFKSVLWNDGEDITFGDLNDNQRFIGAKLVDQFFAKLVGSYAGADPEFGSQQGANAATIWAYALQVGAANLKQGSANNKVKIGAGTLLQKIASADGNNATMLAFTFDGTTELTIANGDGANPRVDLIQMKLEHVSADVQSRDFKDAVTGVNSTTTPSKKQRVQCTVSVKSGAAAASPVYPTPDAGYVPICAVVVGTLYVGAAPLYWADTAGAVAVLHDLRMPICIKPHWSLPGDFLINVTDASWTLSVGATYWQAVGGAGQLYVPCKQTVGRLIAIAMTGANALTTANSHRLYQGSTGSGVKEIADVSSAAVTGTGTNQMTMAQIEAHPVFAAGPVVQGNGTHAPPIWANGKRAPDEFFSNAIDTVPGRLLVFFDGVHATEQVGGVAFYLAGGL